MKNLTKLAEKYGSDKGFVKSAHGYSMLYNLLFFPLRNQKVRILEMGLQIGGPELGKSADRKTTALPSVSMWLEYFPNGHVTGLDISDFSWFEDERFKFIQCDMDQRDNIREVAGTLSRDFDIIFDDASHASHHQQFALLEIWPVLKPGGMYIIEDLHWQPRAYEKRDFTKTGDLFQLFQRNRTFTHSDAEIERALNAITPEIGLAYVFPDKFRKRGAPKILVIQKEY